MDFKYAIFDLDGTLLESMKQWRDCETRQMQKFSGNILSEKQIREFSMMTYRQMIDEITRLTGKEYDYRKNTDELQESMKEYYLNGSVTLKPYAKEYLEYLKIKAVKICAATATPHHMCVPCLKLMGIYKYFDFIQTTEGIRSKKFPDIFDICLEKFGSSKQDTMVFEDARYSAETLYNHGYSFVALKEESQTQSDIEYLKAHAYIYADNLSQLIS